MTREEFIGWCEERFALTKNDIYDLGQLYDEVTKPHWISVEDELPKLNSGMVIVVTYKGDIDFMIFSNSGWHNSKRWCCVKGVITHWMPLPQAPHHFADVSQKVKKGGEQ